MTISYLAVLRQTFGSISGSLAAITTGCWMGWPSPALNKFVNGEVHFSISAEQLSWIVALLDFGNFISPIPSGYMADWLGRKTTLLLSAFIYTTTWALVILGTSAWCLYLARIGAGIGKGLTFTVIPMYLGEIAEARVRGAISTIFLLAYDFGMLFEYTVGPLVSYDALNKLSGLIPIVFFLTFIWMPESPIFLLMKERQKEAVKSLCWFRNADANDEVLVKELDELSKMVDKEMKDKRNFAALIASPGNRKAMIIVIFLSVFQRLTGVSTMLAYTVVTLPKTGGYFGSEVYMIFFASSMIVGNFIGTLLVDNFGRKPLLITSCVGCALTNAISALFYWAAGPQNDLENWNWVPYVCFISFGISFCFGISVVPPTLVAELFPTNMKGNASAISVMSFAVGSFCTNKMYLFVKDNYGTEYMFGFFTVCCIVPVIFTVAMVFETKRKTFSEIQVELNNKTKKTFITEIN